MFAVWRMKQKAAALAAFCALFYVSGCTSSAPNLGKNQASAPYKQLVTVQGDLATAAQELLQQSALADAIYVTSRPTNSGLRLNLELVTTTQTLPNSEPALAGRLSRQSVRPLYTLRYTLLGTDGRMQAAADVQRSGPAQELFLPQLDSTQLAPTNEDKQILVDKLATQLLADIQALPWRARVQQQVQLTHVQIEGGQELGFHYGDMLQTVDSPMAVLQVVTFKRDANGQPVTLLRLIEGRLPSVGRLLIPTIQ